MMPYARLATDTEPMVELRPVRAWDVAALAAIDPGRLGKPVDIQALIRERASVVAVERGEIVGFLALRPGHFYQRDFIDLTSRTDTILASSGAADAVSVPKPSGSLS